MKLEKLNHVAIIATDYDNAYDFYVKKLGLSVISKIERSSKNDIILNLQAPDFVIELFIKTDAPSRLSYPEAAGLRHLCFKTSDIKQDVEELKQLGIKVEEVRFDELNHRAMTFFFDPDGLPIELHE